MKMVKSLLLGSAAGLVALTGAQAADLPVKAKAVEYVKICSAYGAGFYYIPGTDICLRVGGYVRAEYDFWTGFSAPLLGIGEGNAFRFDDNDSHVRFRGRGVVILDARTNTAYGTLRSYMALGGNFNTPALNEQTTQTGNNNSTTFYIERAFIQFAGFTFGYTQSFYDYFSSYAMQNQAGLPNKVVNVFAYTANLGNGVSATLALEDKSPRQGRIYNTNVLAPGAAIAGVAAAYEVPDIVANVRADQPWGSFQASGAVRQLRTNIATPTNDKWGHAVGAGIEIKTPSTGAGDSFQVGGMYTKGMYEYTGISQSATNPTSALGHVNGSGTAPVMYLFDAFAFGSLDLTKAWSASAGFRHFWTPNLRSSINYGYININLSSAVNASPAFFPDLKLNQVITNTTWSPVKNLDLGVDVVYTHLKTANSATVAENGSADVLSGFVRAQRNF